MDPCKGSPNFRKLPYATVGLLQGSEASGLLRFQPKAKAKPPTLWANKASTGLGFRARVYGLGFSEGQPAPCLLGRCNPPGPHRAALDGFSFFCVHRSSAVRSDMVFAYDLCCPKDSPASFSSRSPKKEQTLPELLSLEKRANPSERLTKRLRKKSALLTKTGSRCFEKQEQAVRKRSVHLTDSSKQLEKDQSV